MTDRLMMDQLGGVVWTRRHYYRCGSNVRKGRSRGMHWDRGNMMMSFWVRWALVGRQGVVMGMVLVVRGAVWVGIKGDGEGLMGGGWVVR